MDKRFWAVLGVIGVVFVGILWFQGNKAEAPTGENGKAAATTHIRGDGAKKVALIEYGDFQCPACAGYYPIVEELFTKYKADITMQFRHLPLTQIHQNAFAASRAAEAAGLQGKFFEMYSKLYENQTAWAQASDPRSAFNQYAAQIGLNVETFKKDYASTKVNDAINADLAAFKALGHELSTPTFILNGKKIESPKDAAAFEKVITDAIAAKK